MGKSGFAACFAVSVAPCLQRIRASTQLDAFAAPKVRLSLAQEHMVLLGRCGAEERVAAFLMEWRTRRETLFGPSPTIELPINRQDIADYLGLTIEAASRTFPKLMCDGVLITRPAPYECGTQCGSPLACPAETENASRPVSRVL